MLMWFNPLGLCPAGKGFNRFNIRSGFLRSCVPLKKERVFQRSGCSSGNALCAYSKFKLADASAVALALGGRKRPDSFFLSTQLYERRGATVDSTDGRRDSWFGCRLVGRRTCGAWGC